MQMQREDFFTEKQMELLEAIEKCETVKKAAERLGISYAAAKQRLYRIRCNIRLSEGTLRYLDKIGLDEVLANIPACQTCKFLNNDGWCKHSDAKINVNGFDVPCALWQAGELKSFKAISEGIEVEETQRR
jgi:transcriptional regulator